MSNNKKGNYLKLGSIIKSNKGDGFYLKLDNYNAELYIRIKETEGNLKKGLKEDDYYLLKSASFFTPFESDPEFIEYNVCVNLNNENSAEKQD